MIVKISGRGKSFKGLSAYLTHDPKARTDERVGWTYTLNLTNDHVPSAVHEMYLTAENAELLKQQAGVRAGGRSTKSPVKHISLNWAVDDHPTREHMLLSCGDFLMHMGWHEHQAVLIAHSDKHPHVHIMLNAVHPETGLHLNESHEKRRAQAWALKYEREQDRIHCQQRLKNEQVRERNMPRNIWMEFKVNEQEFALGEAILAENTSEIPENAEAAEWKILKEFQREERAEFFILGKLEFSELRNSIYREVKEEFRPRWAEFYEAKKNGLEGEALATMKAELIADQRDALKPRRNAACLNLLDTRRDRYEELLAHQQSIRQDFRWHKEAGLDVTLFLGELQARRDSVDGVFRPVADELTRRSVAWSSDRDAENERGGRHMPEDVQFDPVDRIGGGVGSFFGALLSDLANLGSARPVPLSPEEEADRFREASENVTKQQQQRGREEDDAAWRERQKDYYRE